MKIRTMTQNSLGIMVCLLAIGLICDPAGAASFTWNGGSLTSDDWSDGDNWAGGIAPDNDGTADIHFAGSTRLSPNVDAAWSVRSITFDSGAAAFSIDGSAISLPVNLITNSSSSTQSIANDVDFTGGFRSLTASSGDVTLTGQWTIASGSTIFARGGHDVTFDGLVTGGGSVNRTDPGTTFLNNNANDFAGSISTAHGVVELGSIANAGVASAIGAGSTISLGQGTWGPSDTGRLRYTGATASTDRTVVMVSNGTTQAVEPSQTLGFSGRPTIEVTNASTTLTFDSDFNYAGSSTLGMWRFFGAGNGVINGDITTTGARIQKSGAGTWTLNGAANNTAITEVLNGTLLVNNTLASSDVLVSSGATLGGNGTPAGNVNIAAGGFLAPGESIGTLNVQQDATIDGSLLIEVDPTGAGSVDLLDVDGVLDISAATVDFDLLAPLNDDAYIFATYGSLTGGSFATVLNKPDGYGIFYNYQDTNQIALVAVPEPASLMVMVLGAAGLVRRRR